MLNSLSEKPKIAVYAICKNEIKFIERFFRSIENADYVVIVDTGSTDGTFEKLVSLIEERTVDYGHEEDLVVEKDREGVIRSASDGEFQVHRGYVDPWRFDDARNIALSLLPETSAVCISIDADELLEPGWKEALIAAVENDMQLHGKPADRYHHRFKTIWNWEASGDSISEHWHERIHSRKGYLWKLPVHEMLVKSDGTPETVRWLENIMMVQKPDGTKSRSNYLPLLEIALKEAPDRWKSWSFYAGELLNAHQNKAALEAIETAKKLPDADLAFLHHQASQVYQSLHDWSNAVTQLMLAVNYAGQTREYGVWLARLYLRLRRPSEALLAARQASTIKERTQGYAFDPSCWGPQFDKFLGELAALPAT